VTLRLFFASDVHGSEVCFRKFLNAAKFYKANIIVLGGDLTGKALVPVVMLPDGRYRLTVDDKRLIAKDSALEEYKTKLRNSGFYLFTTTEEELEEITKDKKKMDAVFLEAIKSSLKSWMELAGQRLGGSGVKCYISPGNDDRFELDEVLKERNFVINPEGRVVELEGDYEMITLGYSNPTPWHSPREVPEEQLADMIGHLADGIRDRAKSIFNIHVPPYSTEIDKAPAVDSELRFQRQGLGSVKMTSAGSTAVRAYIEKYQPLLGLHGHIHESRGFVKLGRTLCVNAGSDYGQGILRGALIDLNGSSVKEYILTTG
jgi:Icc-related predicted phosphoesterase